MLFSGSHIGRSDAPSCDSGVKEYFRGSTQHSDSQTSEAPSADCREFPLPCCREIVTLDSRSPPRWQSNGYGTERHTSRTGRSVRYGDTSRSKSGDNECQHRYSAAESSRHHHIAGLSTAAIASGRLRLVTRQRRFESSIRRLQCFSLGTRENHDFGRPIRSTLAPPRGKRPLVFRLRRPAARRGGVEQLRIVWREDLHPRSRNCSRTKDRPE